MLVHSCTCMSWYLYVSIFGHSLPVLPSDSSSWFRFFLKNEFASCCRTKTMTVNHFKIMLHWSRYELLCIIPAVLLENVYLENVYFSRNNIVSFIGN
jgi:hypothetical protein